MVATQASTLDWSDTGSYDASGRRFDPFRPFPKDERQKLRSNYYAHVAARDGSVDLDMTSLPVRDERLRPLLTSTIEWAGAINSEHFFQRLHHTGNPDLDEKTEWAVGVALCSESERYGVLHELNQLRGRRRKRVDTVHVHHMLQEDYHAVLLDRACRTVGLPGIEFQNPTRVQRTIIRAQVHMPNVIRYPLILVGEVIGCVILKYLRDESRRFSERPEVARHLYEVLDEILYDEQLHSLHCRTRIGSLGLAFARAILPTAVRTVEREYPIFSKMGMGSDELLRQAQSGIEIRPDMDWIEPDEFETADGPH